MAAVDYHLSIAFDIDRQLLTARAQIDLPKDRGIVLLFETLNVSAISINDHQMGAAHAASWKIPASKVPQRLVIDYQKSFQHSDSDLVGKGGIALTGIWHPLPDTDCQFYLQAQVPEDFEAISEADSVTDEVSAGQKTVKFSFSKSARALHFIAGPYIVEQQDLGGGKTLYSYFFKEDAELAAQYRQKAKAYLDRYQKLIGPYPYKRFSIVENRLPTGYAMPTFTLLGQAVARLPFIVDTSLGHEVLHSWFGNAVRVKRDQGNWCEGLTTYLADQAYAAEQGKGVAFRKGQLLKYQHYVNPNNVISLQGFVGGDSHRDANHLAERAVGYGKASMLFHMLSQVVGEDNFVKALQLFYQRQNGKRSDWQDIKLAFEEVSGLELGDFFSQWLERREVPDLSAKNFSLKEVDGDLHLSFSLHQENDPPYSLTVPLLIETLDGKVEPVIEIKDKDKDVDLVLASYPSVLAIDPAYNLMRKLHSAEVTPSWDWFKGSVKKMAVVNSSAEYDIFEPLIDKLEAMGVEIIAANEVKDEDLSANAVIFLGLSGAVPRSLFASPSYPERGMTVDVRRNPLNSLYPAVLISGASREEVVAGTAKLTHYGKYGFLHFEGGHALEKRVKEADDGLQYGLDHQPFAMKVTAALDFNEIIEQLKSSRVVYVGEMHTRYSDHKLQLRVIRELVRRGQKLAVGMEMFPRSVQQTLDDYTTGKIDERTFLQESGYFDGWRYDYRLYRDILNFARRQQLPVIGLNIEKAKVSKVYKEGGISALSPEEKMSLPVDRDLDVPGYRERINAVFKMHPHGGPKQFGGFFQSQAIWDEVMAQTIADYIEKNPDSMMVVLAGNGHVVKNNAIPPRVRRRADVTQSIIMSSDGSDIYPPEVDYVVFAAKEVLPAKVLMGIVMNVDKESDKIVLKEISDQSPAAKAGLHKDDVLLAIDGTEVKSIVDVKVVMLDKKKGDKVEVKIIRAHRIFADEELTLELDL